MKWNYLSYFDLFSLIFTYFHLYSAIFSCEASLSFQNLIDGLTVSYFQSCCHLQTPDEKIYFTKCFSFLPRSSKLIFKTGNGIIQTGNGIISPTSRPLIKKLLLQNVSHLFQGFQNWFSKQEMESSKQKIELFHPIPGL